MLNELLACFASSGTAFVLPLLQWRNSHIGRPEAHGVILGSGRQQRAIGRECDGLHGSLQQHSQATRYTSALGHHACVQARSIPNRSCNAQYAYRVPEEAKRAQLRSEVPNHDRVVGAGGGELAHVGAERQAVDGAAVAAERALQRGIARQHSQCIGFCPGNKRPLYSCRCCLPAAQSVWCQHVCAQDAAAAVTLSRV